MQSRRVWLPEVSDVHDLAGLLAGGGDVALAVPGAIEPSTGRPCWLVRRADGPPRNWRSVEVGGPSASGPTSCAPRRPPSPPRCSSWPSAARLVPERPRWSATTFCGREGTDGRHCGLARREVRQRTFSLCVVVLVVPIHSWSRTWKPRTPPAKTVPVSLCPSGGPAPAVDPGPEEAVPGRRGGASRTASSRHRSSAPTNATVSGRSPSRAWPGWPSSTRRRWTSCSPIPVTPTGRPLQPGRFGREGGGRSQPPGRARRAQLRDAGPVPEDDPARPRGLQRQGPDHPRRRHAGGRRHVRPDHRPGHP